MKAGNALGSATRVQGVILSHDMCYDAWTIISDMSA